MEITGAIRIWLFCAVWLPACLSDRVARELTPHEWLETKQDRQTLAQQVAELRGFPEPEGIAIRFYDAVYFDKHLFEQRQHHLLARGLHEHLILQALGLHDGVPRKAVQLQGFYVPESRHIGIVGRSAADAEQVNYTIAHEMVHVMQLDYLGFTVSEPSTDFDSWLAERSLIEGDARLLELRFKAQRQFRSLSAMLSELAGKLEPGATLQANVDERMSDLAAFPYTRGALFCAALQQTGGLDLLNRAYSIPPETTEQVLHPEKYLAGEPAVSISAPAMNDDAATQITGRLGEAMLHAVLLQCNPPSVASHAAQGWGGDLFLFESRPAERSLTLVTAWDTERDAIEFQKAVSYTGECLDAEESSSSKPRIRGETKSRRRGNAVVVVRGTDGDYDALFALVRRSSPARPPFGPLTARVIRARPRQDFRPDEVKGNLIVSERLGFSIPAPKEYTPKLGQGIRLIRKERPQEALVVYGVPAFYGPASLKRLLDAVSKGAGERFQQVRSTDAWLTTALGRGFQRSWRRKAPAQSLTVTIIPTCKKKALLFVIQTYESAAGKKALDRLVTEIRRLEKVAPLCASVEP